jgi:LysM repeat protein
LLEQLGEAYLAEQQLRSLLVDADGEAARAQALQQLLSRYRRAGNDEAILSVLATAVVRNPTPAYLRELADSLYVLGKSGAALQVALALPVAEQPRQLLLEASYAAGWWTVFEAQLKLIRDTPAYSRWAGLQAQALGDYTQALAHWAQGDAATTSLRQQLSVGLDIRTQLSSDDIGVRRQAVLNWEQWQSRHPGPVTWQTGSPLVSHYAGAETLYNPAQDQSTMAFRATPDEPLTLQVYGPVSLRISARGLHPQDAAAALDDWVSVADGARQTLFPVTDNRPAQGLQLPGAERLLPGLAERFEYRVAPGLHEIRISPQRSPLLFELAVARLRLPLTVLPPLTTATVQAALSGNLGAAQDRPPSLARGMTIDVLRQCGRSQLLTAAADPGILLAGPLPVAGSRVATPGYHTVSSDETLYSIAARYATTVSVLATLNAIETPYTIKVGQRLRLPAATAAAVPDTDRSVYVVTQGDTLYSIARQHATTVSALVQLNALDAPYKLQPGQRLRIRETPATVSRAVLIRQPMSMPQTATAANVYVVNSGDTLYSIATHTGIDYRQLAVLNSIGAPYNIHAGQRLQLGTAADRRMTTAAAGSADSQVLEQMRGILWLAEQDDRQATAMVAKGEALYQQHPDVPGMQRLLRRLRRAAAWELVSAVQASAGVRVVEVQPGRSENPAVRIRKALLPGLLPGEQLLSGFETLVFAVDQPARAHFNIELSMEELTAAPVVPMQVQLQLDDGAERTLLLTPAQPGQLVTQTVPAGKHLLRMRIREPVLNQYLRVLIREQGSRSTHLVASRSGQRTYHVATRDEPIVIDLEGPTRLRIDELREGLTTHRYQNVAAGWQRLQLEAGPHQQQALLRIYRLTSRQPSEPVPARLTAWEPLAVPLPAAMFPADSSQTQRETIDLFPLGGQEDGTWSLTSALVRRLDADDANSGNNQAEDFVELRASHRFFAADKHSYFRTDLLTRLRDAGGPTLGVRSWVDIRRPDWPLEIALGGALYAQRPDNESGNEWAASVRGALSRQFVITPRITHKPVISMFQRWLSMDEDLQQHPDRVDQDLFTEYKHDHRRGLGIADRLTYRPWLDTLMYGSLGAASNENLNVFDPDHVVAALGARQLLHNWQVSAEYQARHYFSDQDRNESVLQNRYGVSLDWLGWRSYKHGWQGRAQLVWDDSSNEFSGFLSISWTHANARFYRDFRPAEHGFRSLRRRQLQEQFFATGDTGMF